MLPSVDYPRIKPTTIKQLNIKITFHSGLPRMGYIGSIENKILSMNFVYRLTFPWLRENIENTPH